MDKLEFSSLTERVKRINCETDRFLAQCKATIHNSTRLQSDVSRLIEDSMVLKEEALAGKCKSLAILNLADEARKSHGRRGIDIPSIEEDTYDALKMLEEIKQTNISSTNPLHNLRSELLALSFLPKGR